MDLKEVKNHKYNLTSHWYYSHKANTIVTLVSDHKISTVLDVGAGDGFFSEFLLKNTSTKKAVCIDTNYESNSVSQISEEKIIEFYSCLPEDHNHKYDLILFMDVIEHVDNDKELIDKYSKFLSEDGIIIVTVPAFQFLWSKHDIYLEHKRRYTINNLKGLAGDLNCQVLVLGYIYALFFPLVILARLIDNLLQRSKLGMMQQYPSPINTILSVVLKIERKFFLFNRYFGISVVAKLKKKSDD